MFLFILILIVFVSPNVAIENFDDEIWSYINEMIKTQGQSYPHIIEPTTNKWPSTQNEPKLLCYFRPRILLWDPLNQYPLLVKDHLECKEHSTNLVSSHWRSKKSWPPRWIYDGQGAVLLVMRTYTCKSGTEQSHFLLSGESCITEQLPSCIEIPFLLSHRAGFTLSLEADIVERYACTMYIF